ncbi:MAG: hypothetical protein INH41_31545 [Myxococcaceae bacterium]|jgi:hypothetical protein|nr:hypothetical protein [Myxococcaceae bacterium]
MTVDWKALVLLLAAWLFSRFAPASERVKRLVFAAACFGVAGLRFAESGTAGNNLVFVLIAGGFGAWYVMQALKLPKG